jgi:hypothetical protein
MTLTLEETALEEETSSISQDHPLMGQLDLGLEED